MPKETGDPKPGGTVPLFGVPRPQRRELPVEWYSWKWWIFAKGHNDGVYCVIDADGSWWPLAFGIFYWWPAKAVNHGEDNAG
jgi:hypothetical protein